MCVVWPWPPGRGKPASRVGHAQEHARRAIWLDGGDGCRGQPMWACLAEPGLTAPFIVFSDVMEGLAATHAGTEDTATRTSTTGWLGSVGGAVDETLPDIGERLMSDVADDFRDEVATGDISSWVDGHHACSDVAEVGADEVGAGLWVFQPVVKDRKHE